MEMFHLTKPLNVVKFDAQGKGSFSSLPASAAVRILGTSAIVGCLQVTYQDEFYSVFRADLLDHSHSRRAALTAHA